jgi:hypothetical protein
MINQARFQKTPMINQARFQKTTLSLTTIQMESWDSS